MARCDEGYLCEVCGDPVDEITDSDLYLRYVIGIVAEAELQQSPERHIRCNPVQAQFIVHAEFDPVTVEGVFSKTELDADHVRQQEALATRGWLRLREVAGSGLSVADYPLSAVERRSLQQ
ncbi:MAG: hypothetical protein ACYTGL_04085 [Planctomycetota bacterium]|jgi:hypothetical protein